MKPKLLAKQETEKEESFSRHDSIVSHTLLPYHNNQRTTTKYGVAAGVDNGRDNGVTINVTGSAYSTLLCMNRALFQDLNKVENNLNILQFD